jgi:serine/threonine protein kinase
MCVLHSNNIAHFDLKPGNILVDDKENLRICLSSFLYLLLFNLLADYGESRFFSKATQTKTKSKVIGTYMYMAPELMSDEEGFIYL